MAETCNREGCPNKGEFYPVIKVPPQFGLMRDALQFVVALRVCRDHVAAFDAAGFLTQDLRRRLRVSLMQQGRAMPDFKRMEIAVGRVGDSTWVQFHAERMRGQRNG